MESYRIFAFDLPANVYLLTNVIISFIYFLKYKMPLIPDKVSQKKNT